MIKTSKLLIMISDGEDHSDTGSCRSNKLGIKKLPLANRKGGTIPLKRMVLSKEKTTIMKW
jgi:hypothetical protein